MFVAIKDDETTYIGVSSKEELCDMSEADYLLEDNLHIAKIAGQNAMFAASGDFLTFQVLTESGKKYMKGEVNAENIVQELVPQIVKINDDYDRYDDKGRADARYAVATPEALYEISLNLSVMQTNISASVYDQLAKGVYLFTEGLPTPKRIVEVYKAIEQFARFELFPISIYDVRTGKRKIYKK